MKVCEKCGSTSFNSISGECANCSVFKHHDFVEAFRLGKSTDDPLSNKILQLLREGKKWRVLQSRNKLCWHPGVKMTNGKCVFCSLQENDTQHVSQRDALSSILSDLDKNIEELKHRRETLQNLLTLSEAGFPVGDVSTMTKPSSPRQRAIQEGKKWYMPYETCKHCGVIAERYVANGRCRNCGQ